MVVSSKIVLKMSPKDHRDLKNYVYAVVLTSPQILVFCLFRKMEK